MTTAQNRRCSQVWQIAAMAHSEGKMLPTMDAMAWAMGCSRSSVQRATDTLVKDGAMVLRKSVVLIDGWRNIRGRSKPTSVIIPTQRFHIVSVDTRRHSGAGKGE